MALTKSIDTIKSKLGTIPVSTGQVIYLSDTEELYFDSSNGTRIQVRDLIILETEAERTAIIAPLTKLYYVKETKVLWVYAGAWVPISESATFTPIWTTDDLNTITQPGHYCGYQADGVETHHYPINECMMALNVYYYTSDWVFQELIDIGRRDRYIRYRAGSTNTWSDWTMVFSSTQSLGTESNWVKFSNNLIIQWGYINATAASGIQQYPVAFPTMVSAIVGGGNYNATPDVRVTLTRAGGNDLLTKFQYDIFRSPAVTADNPQTIYYIALGW